MSKAIQRKTEGAETFFDGPPRSGKILILTPNPPQTLGGVEHFVRELSHGLVARGYGVEVLHRENCMPARGKRKSHPYIGKFSASALGYFIGREVQRKLDDDVVAVISNSDVGYYPLRLPSERTRLIHFYHGTYRGQAEAIRPFISFSGYLYLKWWNSMVLERFSGRSKQVLTCSDPVGDEVRRFFGYASTTICYPMDMSRFFPLNRESSRRELGLPANEAIGVFVGSTQPTKGYPVVRKLIETLPHLNWAVALRGAVPDDILANPRVRVFQDMPSEKIPLLYSAADFALSTSRYDAFPYAVCEALACGTPIISSPNGASRLFLGEQPLNRLLVSHADSTDEFHEVALEILRDPEFYRIAVIKYARAKVEEVMAPENWWRRFFEVTGL